MTNLEIANLLRHVAAAYTITDEAKHRFQIMAYQRAADAIQNTPIQIADLVKDKKLDEVPGIGTALKDHLRELIQTGKVPHFDAVMKSIPSAVFPLLDVQGFGPKKAYKIVRQFHLKNPKTVVADIEKLAKTGKIAGVEGFGEKSQKLMLQHVGEYKKGSGKVVRMLLPFAQEIADTLVAYLKKSPAVITAEPLGSLRRKLTTVGDVDIAVKTKRPKEVIEHFTRYPYKLRVIEKGEATASLLTTSGKQVDIMTQPPESFGSLIQHFTGSKRHNVHLRDLARKKGMSLSEYGITYLKTHKQKLFDTEEKFYKALGMDLIPPELREDTGEIEAALAHNLPQLVDIKDIKGDLHIHSSFPIEPSHDSGTASMEQLCKKAKELRYEYVGFSEHNPSVAKHSRKAMLNILQKKKEYIEHINKSTKDIRAFNLLEIDILSNGTIAIDNKCMDTLDAAIVSVHSSFSGSIESMTNRVLTGLSHPKAKILGHPTGRLINKRTGYQLDWDKMFDFLKTHNKALEINAWYERSDLPDSLIKEAVNHGVKMIINTDAHALDHLELMRYGVWNARRGWATKDAILNTLPYNECKKWLES